LTPFDCDDSDQTIFRGAPEVCGDGKDNNCDGMADEEPCIDGNVPDNCQALEFQGKKYAFCPENLGQWRQPQARLQCLKMGMDLVRLDSVEEATFLVPYITGGNPTQAWVGGADVPEPHKEYVLGSPTEYQWRWISDETIFLVGLAVDAKAVSASIYNPDWLSSHENPSQQPNNLVADYGGVVCRESCMVLRPRGPAGSAADICCNRRTGGGLCEAR
jgi:hypothetical protein